MGFRKDWILKYLLITLVALLASVSGLDAARYYVAPQASPEAEGQHWGDPISLTRASQLAVAGDEIWARSGAYHPDRTDRTRSFVFAAGVQIYGGFAGTETEPGQRNRSANPSILTGDLGTRGRADDNSFTVVVLRSRTGLSSTLDGFVIRDGFAKNFNWNKKRQNVGGALFIEPTATGDAIHHISNCTFLNNVAHNGGAVFVSPGRTTFTNCLFRSNQADKYGGAVYVNGEAAMASPVFQGCIFENNRGNYAGGGIAHDATNGVVRPLIVGCTFVGNYSNSNGAAVYNRGAHEGDCDLVIQECTYRDNTSTIGEDVADSGVSVATRTRARQHGGGTLRPGRK